MLQKISDRIQGWVAGVMVVVIALVFALWGVEYYIGRDSAGSKSVATVNGQKISEKQLNLLYHQLLQRIRSQSNRQISLQEQKQIQSLALERIISKILLLQAARKQGFAVNWQQVEQAIMLAPEFQVKGLFSPQRFGQLLLSARMTEKQFMSEVHDNLLANQMRMGLENSVFSLPSEINRLYQLTHQKRDFGYFTVPFAQFLKNVQISNREVENYYDKHKASYKSAEKIKVNYLLLSSQSIAKNIKISLEDLQSYYQVNKASFKEPKQWKVLQITVPIALAANSQKISMAKQHLRQIQHQLEKGGSLKSILKQTKATSSTHVYTLATMPKNRARVITTTDLGQISKFITTPSAVFFIKVISITPEKLRSFQTVKNDIQKRLLQQRVEQILSQKSELLADLTYTHPTTLDVAAKKLTIPIQTSPWLTRKGLKNSIFSNNKLITTAFSDDVLQDKNNSYVINLPDGSVVVLRVNQYKATRLRPLSEVKPLIIGILKKNKAEAAAGLQAYQISSALAKGTTVVSLAKRFNIKWISKKSVQRNDHTVPKPILSSVFSTSPPLRIKNNTLSGINTLVLANGDYVVFKVFALRLADISHIPMKEFDQLKKHLNQLNVSQQYRFYTQSITNLSKIRIDSKNIESRN